MLLDNAQPPRWVRSTSFCARTGRSLQVGFQAVGSATLPTLHDVVARGEIEDLTGGGAVGTWLRYENYWLRLDRQTNHCLRPVVEGVVANPLG